MVRIGEVFLNREIIENIIFSGELIELDPEKMKAIEAGYSLIEKLANAEKAYYGINTGFGALAEQRISADEQSILQKNILLSHATGLGPILDYASAKTMMLLRINTLARGFSGVSPQLLKHMVKLFNLGFAPLVPKKGSVGASGDLAPLAHLGLMLLGLGECLNSQGQKISSAEALNQAGLKAIELGVRDGLAIVNGTQAMGACALVGLIKIKKLLQLADITAACTLNALAGHLTPFDERLHRLKPHPGQITTAKNILAASHGRTIQEHVKNPLTQDPYSLRCVPQVHGASKDAYAHCKEVIEREINSVTDNPLLFFNEITEPDILSGGNFHGQSLALVLDYLAMATAELANISERRIELLVNSKHSHGLPPFLAPKSGLNSGYMMMHVTASALVSENKVLCHPASVDSIPTSASREDHVSMGMISANKLLEVVQNVEDVLAIELQCAHQALFFRPDNSAGYMVEKIHRCLEQQVPKRESDIVFIEDHLKIKELISSSHFTSLYRDIIKTN